VTREQLIPRLQSIKASEGDTVVYVRADTSLPYGDVMLILGQVGESGFSRVSLLSSRLQGAPQSASPPASPN
jgi:biopolymer transport protein TolR